MTISVSHAKTLARQWILDNASNDAGFVGAYFAGSITELSDGTTLEQSSDVDIGVVRSRPDQMAVSGKFRHNDIILDVANVPITQVETPEQVLGHYHLAGAFRGPNIIVDRSGHLTTLQQSVSRDFAKRTWVYQRCEHARQGVVRWIERVDQPAPFHDQVAAWLFGAGVLTHILLVAGLKNPTIRRRYLAVRDLLAEYEQLEFYETLLELQGSSRMTREHVQHHLAALTEVFDFTKTVVKTPYRFAADISDLGRPIAIGGSRELIEQGYHREAVFWIVATYCRCLAILHYDASEVMQRQYGRGFRELVSDLGIMSLADLQQKREQVEDHLPAVWEMAETIMDENSKIND